MWLMASYGEDLKFSACGFSQPRYMGQEESARELTLPGTDLSHHEENLAVNVHLFIL